jgi:hypothetical protein
METYEFSLNAPPRMEGKSVKEQAEHILPWIRKQEAEYREL